MDAKTDNLQGEDAAHVIFAWDEVALSIQNHCQISEKRIKREVQSILLEAMRLKDEKSEQNASLRDDLSIEETIAAVTEPVKSSEFESKNGELLVGKAQDPIKVIRQKLEEILKSRGGIQEVFHDSKSVPFCEHVQSMGDKMKIGRLKLAYLNSGTETDVVIIPEYHQPVVVYVDSNTPKDKIIRALIK